MGENKDKKGLGETRERGGVQSFSGEIMARGLPKTRVEPWLREIALSNELLSNELKKWFHDPENREAYKRRDKEELTERA